MATLVLGGVLLGSACSSRLATHGNFVEADELAKLQPGETTRDEVVQVLGTPSSVANFEDETWFYIGNRTKTTAFFAPEELDRKVVIVRFDHDGRVSGIETKGLEDGRNLELVDRETPTAGSEMTILQQLLGNIGRFNTAESE